MLKTLGYKDSYIISLFCIEGSLIGVLGSLVGLVLGIPISLYYEVKGIDFSSIGKDVDMGYRINTIMYTDVNFTKILLLCLLAILFCTLAAYIAVRKPTKGEIAEQMRRI